MAETKTTFHRNGRRHEVCPLLDGLEHGTVECWRDDGTLFMTAGYAHGQRHGEMKTFHRSGRLQAVVRWERDMREGRAEFFFENGDPQSEIDYRGGLRHGAARHPGGAVAVAGENRRGVPCGLWRFFSPEGCPTGVRDADAAPQKEHFSGPAGAARPAGR